MSDSPGTTLHTDLPDVLQDLKRRFRGFDVPAEKIDSRTLSQSELRRFGLPPRPDPRAQAPLMSIWERGFGRPIQLLRYEFSRERIQGATYRPAPRRVDELHAAETRWETSSNWSGVYISANHSRHLIQVWGSWRIPDNLAVPPPPFAGANDIPYMCSNWIGLDGQRRYVDSSLPQIGTESELRADGSTAASAWVQWWARNSVDPQPLPIGLEVQPGQDVLCVLTVCDPQTVRMIIVNLSTGQGMPMLAIAPSVTLPDGHSVIPDITGATAEWIVERPKIAGQELRYNFPDFGETGFDDCVAVAADEVDILGLFGGVPQVLDGERMIRMFDVLEHPHRTAFISMPSKSSEAAIRVKYGGFGLP